MRCEVSPDPLFSWTSTVPLATKTLSLYTFDRAFIESFRWVSKVTLWWSLLFASFIFFVFLKIFALELQTWDLKVFLTCFSFHQRRHECWPPETASKTHAFELESSRSQYSFIVAIVMQVQANSATTNKEWGESVSWYRIVYHYQVCGEGSAQGHHLWTQNSPLDYQCYLNWHGRHSNLLRCAYHLDSWNLVWEEKYQWQDFCWNLESQDFQGKFSAHMHPRLYICLQKGLTRICIQLLLFKAAVMCAEADYIHVFQWSTRTNNVMGSNGHHARMSCHASDYYHQEQWGADSRKVPWSS